MPETTGALLDRLEAALREQDGFVTTHQAERLGVRRSKLDGDIVHAVEHALVVADLDEGPPLRVLLIGPDRAANILEVIALEFDDGRVLVIRAIPLRATYHHLLP